MEVSIRPIEVTDITDEFVSWHQNVDGHLDYYTGSRRSFTRGDLVSWIEGSEQSNTFFYLILIDNKEPVGTIKIGPIDEKNKTSDLVCLIGNREYVGRGLASRAIVEGNREAFEHHDVRRLQGGMYESNVASIKAYCRADWVIEGRMKGYYWIDGEPIDRVCVACFNPKYFDRRANDEN